MTYAICCPLWSSVYKCHKVECAFTSPVRTECGVCDVLYAVLYVCVSCFVVRGCAVSRRYTNVCINGRWYVCCGECYVVSNECDEPTSCLVQPIIVHCCEGMYFGCFGFRGELGFQNCDEICMCVVNKQFELLEFVFDYVYVDLQYDEIYFTFTVGSVCLCGVCSPVVVLGLSVRLSWYHML